MDNNEQIVMLAPPIQEEDLETAACVVQCDCNVKG
jgi:hypothetical protein